ncbi:MAG: hypothetical protein M5U12_12470 [Verrucomicrobia bacterium]|nr:hypothetical protein [Verrucomicrobiota bacterium]
MNIELLQDHWVNGRKFAPGTILDLPEPAARNLIEAGAAQALTCLRQPVRVRTCLRQTLRSRQARTGGGFGKPTRNPQPQP